MASASISCENIANVADIANSKIPQNAESTSAQYSVTYAKC